MVPSDSDRWQAARQEYLRLKQAGHAVILDTVVTSDESFVSVTIHHYTTCRACAK